MISPLLIEASKDKSIRGAPFTVLCYLHSILELGEYRVVKHLSVAADVGLTRQCISESLSKLVKHGYLRAGIKGSRNVGSYMLLASRGDSVKQSA